MAHRKGLLMNKAITDGLDLMPPPFVDGLNVWSSGDGTPGSTSYSSDPNGNLVLRYRFEDAGKPVLEDLKRLLRLSQIG